MNPRYAQHRDHPLSVLLVEDDPGDVLIAREALAAGRLSTDLHVVNDGDEALSYLRQLDGYADATRPDLILLDLNLPKKSGHEVLAEVKQDPQLRRIPVVVLTTSQAQEDVEVHRRPHVPDVRLRLHRQPADVESRLPLLEGHEVTDLAGLGVVEPEHPASLGTPKDRADSPRGGPATPAARPRCRRSRRSA